MKNMKNTKAAFAIVCFLAMVTSNIACAQLEDALLNLMATPQPRLIALLSEEKASLWDSIRSTLGNLDSIRTIARQYDLRVIPPNVENEEATIVIDNKLLVSSSQYELAVLDFLTEALSSKKYFTLDELIKDQLRGESLLEWLERYAPMRFLNIRTLDSRFDEVLIFPIGLIRAKMQIEDGRMLSGYVAEIYPSEKTDIQFAKELFQQSSLDYKASDIEQYTGQLINQIKKKQENCSIKMNVFSMGIPQEKLNEIVANVLAKHTAEAVEQAQRQRKSTLEHLHSMLRDICRDRFGSDLRDISSLEELPESIKSSIIETLRSENLDNKSLRSLHLEIRPGIAIGIIRKFKKHYGVFKIDLAEHGSAGMAGYPLDIDLE